MGLVRNDDHTGIATSTLGKRLYSCDAPSCDVRRVPWTAGWQWYGSWRDIDDDPFSIVTFCSENCKTEGEKMMNPQPLKAVND